MKRRGFIDENGNQVVCLYGDKAKDARTGKVYNIIDLPEPERRSEMMRLMEVSNQQSRRIAELEAQNEKLKAAITRACSNCWAKDAPDAAQCRLCGLKNALKGENP